jgi:hypothetical protein
MGDLMSSNLPIHMEWYEIYLSYAGDEIRTYGLKPVIIFTKINLLVSACLESELLLNKSS